MLFQFLQCFKMDLNDTERLVKYGVDVEKYKKINIIYDMLSECESYDICYFLCYLFDNYIDSNDFDSIIAKLDSCDGYLGNLL